MLSLLKRYANWLHLQWPAGKSEPLPRVDGNNRTNVPGVYVVGDLAGVPLLKFSLESGVQTARKIAKEAPAEAERDAIIIGAGAAGMAAAREAKKLGLSFLVLEANDRFATLRDFQVRKPIYTYPEAMTPAGDVQVTAGVKEDLVLEMEAQTEDIPVKRGRALSISRNRNRLEVHLEGGETLEAGSVIVAIGRSGNFRALDVPGENLDKVHHLLRDPSGHAGQDVLVVGGGDSALEAAIALVENGANVTLSYRRDVFVRPREATIERLRELEGESLQVLMETEVESIEPDGVRLTWQGGGETIRNDAVFATIGREPPLTFFRRSGIKLQHDWGTRGAFEWRSIFRNKNTGRLRQALQALHWNRVAAMATFVLFMAAVYSWSKEGWLHRMAQEASVFPFALAEIVAGLDPTSLVGIIVTSAQTPSFYYTVAYSLIIVIFGFRRIRRRKTQYVKWQTYTLMAIQVIPLFLLPEILLPYLGANGLLPDAFLNALFPVTEWSVHGREYWRAYGFILAWPLLVYNVFTPDPLGWWLAICFVQTFVLIPGMIYFWGKGAYCGWICSCGALAETLGDTQRDKMPHGEGWNRFNMAGQVIMVLAFVLLIFRIGGWIWPGSWFDGLFSALMYGSFFGLQLNYSWVVDVVLAGMIGYGVYFWLSGRFWCRFLCPLAALMNIFNRFSRFRILAEKEKCISCNACTSVCHQGIDVMSFAQQGLPMEDPQCVRCSACVHECPTGVLSFGQVDPATEVVIKRDDLVASLVRAGEDGASKGAG